MGRQDEIVKERMKKIEDLRKNGINPYAHKSEVSHTTQELQEKYKSLKNEGSQKDKVSAHGRLLGIRDLGKIAFGTMDDGTGKIQLLFQDSITPEKVFEFMRKYIDGGDFVEAHGTVLRTKSFTLFQKSGMEYKMKKKDIEKDIWTLL
jgi:lysyl-tRNA synthetase class 2